MNSLRKEVQSGCPDGCVAKVGGIRDSSGGGCPSVRPLLVGQRGLVEFVADCQESPRLAGIRPRHGPAPSAAGRLPGPTFPAVKNSRPPVLPFRLMERPSGTLQIWRPALRPRRAGGNPVVRRKRNDPASAWPHKKNAAPREPWLHIYCNINLFVDSPNVRAAECSF